MSPFHLVYGRNLNAIPSGLPLAKGQTPATVSAPAAQEFTEKLDRLVATARDRLHSAQLHQAAQANKGRAEIVFKVGEKVLLSAEHYSDDVLRAATPKFDDRFLGPFTIKRVVSSGACELDLPARFSIHPVMNVSQLKKFVDNPTEFASRAPPRPSPVIVAGKEEYVVDEVLDHRKRYKKLEYLVRWRGFPESENSWEPEANLGNNASLKAYKRLKRGEM